MERCKGSSNYFAFHNCTSEPKGAFGALISIVERVVYSFICQVDYFKKAKKVFSLFQSINEQILWNPQGFWRLFFLFFVLITLYSEARQPAPAKAESFPHSRSTLRPYEVCVYQRLDRQCCLIHFCAWDTGVAIAICSLCGAGSLFAVE